jgi:hypothetical protein
MSYYPNLEPSVRARLAERGIDPDRSTTAFLLSIMDGSFPIRDGLPLAPDSRLKLIAARRRSRWHRARIPMAVVLTDEESKARKRAS